MEKEYIYILKWMDYEGDNLSGIYGVYTTYDLALRSMYILKRKYKMFNKKHKMFKNGLIFSYKTFWSFTIEKEELNVIPLLDE